MTVPTPSSGSARSNPGVDADIEDHPRRPDLAAAVLAAVPTRQRVDVLAGAGLDGVVDLADDREAPGGVVWIGRARPDPGVGPDLSLLDAAALGVDQHPVRPGS